jgi:transcriptional regulator with XRE-family HTH domain
MKKAAAKTGVGRPRGARPDSMEGRLGERIEAVRKERGVAIGDLAQIAEIGRGTIGRIEQGAVSATIGNVLAIAHALGLSGEQLMKKVPDWTEKLGD